MPACFVACVVPALTYVKKYAPLLTPWRLASGAFFFAVRQ